MAEIKKIEISHRTIIFTVLFLLFLYVLFLVRRILVIFFISVVLMSALNPAVNRLEKWRLPRLLAILVIYLLVIVGLALIIAGVAPPLVEQTGILIDRLPGYIENLRLPWGKIQDFQVSQLGSLPANLVRITVSVFSNLLNAFLLFVLTFYLLIERKNLDRYFQFLFGSDGEERAKRFVDTLEHKLGGWVRAQAALMLIIGGLSYMGLTLLGIDFALPLALIAGVLELVPGVGPTLSAVPAVLAGLAVSPLMGLAVLALYFLIQQLENSLIVPQVMSRGTGVNPLVALLALVIGYELAGVVGSILAIPVLLLAQIIGVEAMASKKFQEF